MGCPSRKIHGTILKMDERRNSTNRPENLTKKIKTMHKTLYHINDVNRRYVSRKEGGGGLASIQDNDDASIQRIEYYR